MKKTSKLTLLLFLSSIASLPVRPAAAQKTQYSLSPAGCRNLFQEYDHALDLLFPRNATIKGVRAIDVDYRIVLRYLPSFHTESQIVIVKTKNGAFDLTRYGLPGGGQSIWSRLNQFYEKQTCPTDADLLSIGVLTKNVKPVPDQLKQLIADLFQQRISLVIDPNMRPGLTAKEHRSLMMEDGETVYFWLDGVQDSVFFRLWGPWGVETHFQSPLYDWADRVRNCFGGF